MTALAVLFFCAAPLSGQSPNDSPRHRGLRVGLGYGGAAYDVECIRCVTTGTRPDSWQGGHGGGANVRLGGGTSRHFVLGVEAGIQGVYDSIAHSSTVLHLVLTGQYHPPALEGFYLAGGAGPASIMLGTGGGSLEAYGSLLRVGAGYEFGIGERVTVGPYASVGRLAFNPDKTRTYGSVSSAENAESKRMFQYGLALHWHP